MKSAERDHSRNRQTARALARGREPPPPLDTIKAKAPTKARSSLPHDNAVFAGGGDYPGNEVIIGSGRDALLCRYKSGRPPARRERHRITLEFAGDRPALPRRRSNAHRRGQTTAARCTGPTMRPPKGRSARLPGGDASRPYTAGDVFAAHARRLRMSTLISTPAQRLRLLARRQDYASPGWACRCSARTMSWELVPGMVMFARSILMDSEARPPCASAELI